MDKIYVNSIIKNTLNKKLIYHVLSIRKGKKLNANNIETDDYIIEYNLYYNNVNGERVRYDNFTHESYLSDFGNSEANFLTAIIKYKGLVYEEKEMVVEATIID